MADRNRKEVDKLVDAVEDMRGILEELTRSVLADLVRRAEQAPTPDGYPASSRGGSGAGGTSDPTGAVVVQRSEPQRRDVVGDTLAEIFTSLQEAAGHLRRIDKMRKAVVNAGYLVKDHDSSRTSTCECCGRTMTGDGEDRLKSGYGATCCYQPWRRWKAAEIAAGREPSRSAFEYWHAAQHQPPARDQRWPGYEVDDIDGLQASKVLPA